MGRDKTWEYYNMRKQLTTIALAAGMAAGLSTAAEAQWGGPGYGGGYAPGYGGYAPGYAPGYGGWGGAPWGGNNGWGGSPWGGNRSRLMWSPCPDALSTLGTPRCVSTLRIRP